VPLLEDLRWEIEMEFVSGNQSTSAPNTLAESTDAVRGTVNKAVLEVCLVRISSWDGYLYINPTKVYTKQVLQQLDVK
jgi:hypothetical protein